MSRIGLFSYRLGEAPLHGSPIVAPGIRPLLVLLSFVACSAKVEVVRQGAPQEVTSFSLRRNIIWSSANQSGSHFILIDTEVVRMIDQVGEEVWGRRLSIGALRSGAFCSKGVVVIGEKRAAFLNEDGLLQPWPFSNTSPQWVARSTTGGCLFDTTELATGSWREGERWLTSDGKQLIESSEKTLSAPSWKGQISCDPACPISIWSDQVVVAEPAALAFFSLADGTRAEAAIGLGEGRIISLSSAGSTLALSRDDGSIQIWQGMP